MGLLQNFQCPISKNSKCIMRLNATIQLQMNRIPWINLLMWTSLILYVLSKSGQCSIKMKILSFVFFKTNAMYFCLKSSLNLYSILQKTKYGTSTIFLF